VINILKSMDGTKIETEEILSTLKQIGPEKVVGILILLKKNKLVFVSKILIKEGESFFV
jgi:hypothetical protein